MPYTKIKYDKYAWSVCWILSFLLRVQFSCTDVFVVPNMKRWATQDIWIWEMNGNVKHFHCRWLRKKEPITLFAIWHVPCSSICYGLQGIFYYNCTAQFSYLQFLPRPKHLLFIFLSLKLMQFHCSFVFGYFLLHPKLIEVQEDKGEGRNRSLFISTFE